MKHLIGTASAAGIAFGLALFASTAYAQQSSGADDGSKAQTTTTSSNNSNSQNTTYTVPISNSLNDNSTRNTDKSQHFDQSQRNDNSQNYDQSQRNDNSTGHNDNSQHYDQSQRNDNSTGHNDNSQKNDNSLNYYVPVTDSGNTLKDHHDNNSTNSSYNTSLRTGDISLAMSSADLDGNVSNQTFNASGANGGMSSGALSFSGNAMQGYAGITNANYVSGQGSLGQAANSVTATSSISFR